MSLSDSFNTAIAKRNLFKKDDRLIVAASGGLDSTVLCELCRQNNFHFEIAHCNFQLRGPESDRDETFTRELANKYNVPFHIIKFDTAAYATTQKISIQEAARKLRYDWFRSLTQPGSALILTAHHADDNSETILMNFTRGTGLQGLKGIPAVHDYIRRPLLDFTRKELKNFADEHRLDFVEDSSNESTKYTRNLFRHEVLPLIRQVYPAVSENLVDNARRFAEVNSLYEMMLTDLKKKLIIKKDNEIHIPILKLLSYKNRALVFEILRPYGFSEKQLDEVGKLAVSDSGKFINASEQPYRLIRHRHWFIIAPTQSAEPAAHYIIDRAGSYKFEYLTLSITTTEASQSPVSSDPATVMIDAAAAQFPLLLRKWKTGDYFYPLGMKKKKN
jgi:tRNA(Ile)-lysidine synthase